jgi:chemotaxis protein methyltransferase CheR
MTPQLFAIFAPLVEEACGLHYRDADRALFSAKVAAHAETRGHGALLDYYYRLRYDDPTGAEMATLVEALLVHETYFFREVAPLAELVDSCLAPAVAARGGARVWSAACSTGEEPYTLAMLLAEQGLLERVEIVATDISPRAVSAARLGRHSRRALRDNRVERLVDRYLALDPDGITVAPSIRDAVKFATVNLIDPAEHLALGAFDAVLCRNVLIYFTDPEILRVIARLAAHLRPGGLLAVGIAESLLRFGTTLVCEERKSSFFYRVAA